MKYDWKQAGEEWSEPWGTSDAQWNGTIFPRIRDWLPTGTILEIAPGFGRWTHFLKDYGDELWAVDQTADSRLGASSKPRHDRRVISRFVRAERTALHHSRACKLAWPTLDRLSVAICPKRFSGGKCHEDHPKSKFHARGRENSPGIEETTLIDPR